MPEILNLSSTPGAEVKLGQSPTNGLQPIEISEENQDFSSTLSALLPSSDVVLTSVAELQVAVADLQEIAAEAAQADANDNAVGGLPIAPSPMVRLPVEAGSGLFRQTMNVQATRAVPTSAAALSTVAKTVPVDPDPGQAQEFVKIHAIEGRADNDLLDFDGERVPRERPLESPFKGVNAPGTVGTAAEIESKAMSPELRIGLREPIGTARWSQEIASRVTVFAREGIHSARVELNPPSMGPMDVRVKVVDDAVEVSFVVQHSATRDMLEGAVSRLREEMQQNGFARVDVDISQGDTREQAADKNAGKEFGISGEDSQTQGVGSEGRRPAVGLIDVFA